MEIEKDRVFGKSKRTLSFCYWRVSVSVVGRLSFI